MDLLLCTFYIIKCALTPVWLPFPSHMLNCPEQMCPFAYSSERGSSFNISLSIDRENGLRGNKESLCFLMLPKSYVGWTTSFPPLCSRICFLSSQWTWAIIWSVVRSCSRLLQVVSLSLLQAWYWVCFVSLHSPSRSCQPLEELYKGKPQRRNLIILSLTSAGA